jgi:apolipoprotein N-acyltransferase
MLKKVGPLPALAALSGLLLPLAFAPARLGWLAWLAPAPLLYAVTRSSGPAEAAGLGGLAGLIFYSFGLAWMPNVVHFLALPFWCIFALWLALFAALARALWTEPEKSRRPQLRALLWAVAAGLLWAGIEYFRSEAWPLRCPWLGLGYSQAFALPVYQSLSVWGIYGLSGFMAAFAAAWALAPRRAWLPAAVLSAALLSVFLWGRHRLASLPAENGAPVTAALVQAENSDIAKLAALSLAPEAARADLLVWPEYSFYLPGPEQAPTLAALARALRPSAAVAVLGAGVNADEERGVKRANFAFLLDRDKRLIGVYNKMHPVQFVEAGLPSHSEALPVDTPLSRLAPQICYDLAFEDGTRKMARAGGALLIVPTLDPMEWGKLQHEQHSDMSSARAVEAGLWLVRAASSGRSQAIDRLGRETATLESGKEGVLLARAYIGPGGTFYTRFGWLAGPLCLAFALGAAVFAAARGTFKR